MKKLALVFLASVGIGNAMEEISFKDIKNTFVNEGPSNKDYSLKYENHRNDTKKKFENLLRLRMTQLERLIEKRSISNPYSKKVLELQEELNRVSDVSNDLENLPYDILVTDHEGGNITQGAEKQISDIFELNAIFAKTSNKQGLQNKQEVTMKKVIESIAHVQGQGGDENNGIYHVNEKHNYNIDNQPNSPVGYRNKQIQNVAPQGQRESYSGVLISNDIMDVIQVMAGKNIEDYNEKDKQIYKKLKDAFVSSAADGKMKKIEFSE